MQIQKIEFELNKRSMKFFDCGKNRVELNNQLRFLNQIKPDQDCGNRILHAIPYSAARNVHLRLKHVHSIAFFLLMTKIVNLTPLFQF